MAPALPQTSKRIIARDLLEVCSQRSDSGIISSDAAPENLTLVIEHPRRSFFAYLRQNVSTRHVSRRRAYLFRWTLAGACTALLGIIAAIVWLSLVSALIHRLSPRVPSTGLQYVVDNWQSPKDALPLLKGLKKDLSNDLVPKPIHSHNDYWRKVPLFEALAVGCIGVEADIWLPDSPSSTDLRVGHKKSALTTERTLSSLYIDPLLYMLDSQNHQNNSPHLDGIFTTYPNTTVILLLDFKSDPVALWPLVNDALQPLRSPRNYLRSWNVTTNKINPGPLTIVATGNADLSLVMVNNKYRDIFLDAPLTDIHDKSYDISNSYYASSSLGVAIGHSWFGRFSSAQSSKLDDQIATAADKGLLSRYWDTPSWPTSVRDRVWDTLAEKSVGMLNVDDISAAAQWNWDWCIVAGLSLC